MKRRAGCIAQKWVTAALVLSGIVCFAIGASVAFAGEDSDLETSRKTVELDTITVTVQRQEENVQKVPVSVTVMGQTEIEDRKIESIGDLSDFVPNFMINNEGASGMNAPVMRGIYANATTLTVSSGLFVDGVPVLSSTGYEDTILDIERVEVLRGPQGTLYGKNTVSQELRLDSSSENIQWLVGLYYDNDRNEFNFAMDSDYPAMASTTRRDFNGEAYAAFGQISYAPIEGIRVIGGLRYEIQDQEYENHNLDTTIDDSWNELSSQTVFGIQLDTIHDDRCECIQRLPLGRIQHVCHGPAIQFL